MLAKSFKQFTFVVALPILIVGAVKYCADYDELVAYFQIFKDGIMK